MTSILDAALAVVSAARHEVASPTHDPVVCPTHPCGLCSALAAFDGTRAPVFLGAADAVYADTAPCYGVHLPNDVGFCAVCNQATA